MVPVLFLMPRWEDPTELFLQRQIRMLANVNVLDSIVTDDAGAASHWCGRIPVHSLIDKRLSRRLMQAAGRRLRFDYFQPLDQLKVLEKLLGSSRAKTILCQFGTYAVRLKSVLTATPQR